MAIVRARLDIPIDSAVLEQLEGQADAIGISVEHLIAARLTRFKDQTDDDLVILGAAQMKQIRSMLGNKVSTADRIVDMIKRLTTFKVGGFGIKLTPNQQEQIHWVAKSAGKPVQAVAEQLISEAVAQRLRTR